MRVALVREDGAHEEGDPDVATSSCALRSDAELGDVDGLAFAARCALRSRLEGAIRGGGAPGWGRDGLAFAFPIAAYLRKDVVQILCRVPAVGEDVGKPQR